MPATPARIGFIIEQYRLAISGPDASVVDKYGKAARDTTDPLPTFFDNVADAQLVSDERLTLLSPDRRRFSATAAGAIALPSQLSVAPTVPTVHVSDDESAADLDAVVVELGLDFEAGTSTLVAWG